MRPTELVPQFAQPRRATGPQLRFGLALMTLGLFNKVVLADSFLSSVAERVYDGDKIPGALDAWAATLAFSGQIFCDFAGYSTTAIGAALCLGFAMPDNFRFPYAAVGFSDFWRRWHITLSAWLRDYLYIPLGGSRHGARRTYLALMSTTWVFFRAKTFSKAWIVLRGMAGQNEGARPILATFSLMSAAAIVGTLVLTHWLMRARTLESVIARTPAAAVCALWAFMAFGIVIAQGSGNAFIYFQF
jgi:alginate O-acetyltransferase complex protein AlgI